MEKVGIPQDNCPVAPPPRVTVHTRVLHRACQVAGGVEHLAKELGVSAALLHRWLEGDGVPPARIFLKAVDMIVPTWGPDDEAFARHIAASRRPKKN